MTEDRQPVLVRIMRDARVSDAHRTRLYRINIFLFRLAVWVWGFLAAGGVACSAILLFVWFRSVRDGTGEVWHIGFLTLPVLFILGSLKGINASRDMGTRLRSEYEAFREQKLGA